MISDGNHTDTMRFTAENVISDTNLEWNIQVTEIEIILLIYLFKFVATDGVIRFDDHNDHIAPRSSMYCYMCIYDDDNAVIS